MVKLTIIHFTIILIFMFTTSSWSESIPNEVFSESYKAHRAWLGVQVGIRNDERIDELVPSIEELRASPWCPYKIYKIQPAVLAKCESGHDIIEKFELIGYRAPILLGDEIVNYSTIKCSKDSTTGLESWEMTGFGTSQPEVESYYYSLLNEFPTDQGYALYVFWMKYAASRRFVLIVDPEKNYYLYPATKNSLLYLKQVTEKDYAQEPILLEQLLPLLKAAF